MLCSGNGYLRVYGARLLLTSIKNLQQRVTGKLNLAVMTLVFIRGVPGSNTFLTTDYVEIFVGLFSYYRQVCGMMSCFCCGSVDGRSSEMLRGVGC